MIEPSGLKNVTLDLVDLSKHHKKYSFLEAIFLYFFKDVQSRLCRYLFYSCNYSVRLVSPRRDIFYESLQSNRNIS